jgi:N,N'-diacetyllegionaminate synthase
VMHCTSAYPAPFNEVNLLAMRSIREQFDISVGYSDHTCDVEVAIAAVALGATIIEKHFTLDKDLPGPDHQASLDPQQLKLMISQIKNVESCMGDGIKRPTASEAEILPIARKSIVAKRRIMKGEVLSEQNLATKRPGTGISAIYWDRFMGKLAYRNFEEDELIDEA